MKLRCDLHVNGTSRKLFIVQGPNETGEHLALKLAAYLLFWDLEPIIDASPKTPALAAFDFMPDVLALNEAGEATLWVECGSVTMNKLLKLTRRLPQARVIVLKETQREAERLRLDISEQLDRHEKVEIMAWPGRQFKDWLATLQEKTEVFGEAGGLTLNVVVNEHLVVAELTTH